MVQNKNYGRYLPQCLNSILNQGIQQDEYEILGLDAGSTDNSQRIYRKLIGTFVDVTGCNQAEALNIALKMAKGKYVGWINSDDYYKPNYAKTHISLFDKFKHQNVSITFAERLSHRTIHKGIATAVTRIRQIPYFIQMDNDKRQNWAKRKLALSHNPFILLRKLLYFSPSSPMLPERSFLFNKLLMNKGVKVNVNSFREECVHNPAAMFKKNKIVQVGGWNEKLTFCIDDDLFLRLAQIGNLVYTPKFTAVCRTHGKNMSLLNMVAQELEVKAFYDHYANAQLGELFIDS